MSMVTSMTAWMKSTVKMNITGDRNAANTDSTDEVKSGDGEVGGYAVTYFRNVIL